MPYFIDDDIPGYPLTLTSSPASPLCADKNPYLDRDAEIYLDGAEEGEDPPRWWDTAGGGTYGDEDRTGNSAAHERDGQNVLYNDSHVSFEKLPNVGVEKDNIWKYWPGRPPSEFKINKARIQLGQLRVNGSISGGISGGCLPPLGPGRTDGGAPQAERDAYLVNEMGAAGG